MNHRFQELINALALVFCAILLLNPFHIWMPNMVALFVLALILVFFGIFASFLLREQAGDERDVLHRMLAGRNAFLSGSFVLLSGIVVESFSHHTVDPWIVIALVVMIVVKIGSRVWTDRNR